MVFDVLGIQRKHVELLHVADQLRAIEIAETYSCTGPDGPERVSHGIVLLLGTHSKVA